MGITLRFSDDATERAAGPTKQGYFIAFSWATDGSVFYADDHTGTLSQPTAYGPFSLHHPLNQSGHNLPVDINHSFPLENASASIWHSEAAMFGSITFKTAFDMNRITGSIARGEFAAISPEIDHIESEYIRDETGEHVKVVSSARVKCLSFVARSANPNSRIWRQAYSMEQPAGGCYDPTFHRDWSEYVAAFHADPGRTASASIAWNRFVGAY